MTTLARRPCRVLRLVVLSALLLGPPLLVRPFPGPDILQAQPAPTGAEPAAQPADASAPPPSVPAAGPVIPVDPRNFYHVFAAYGVAWALVLGYAVSVGRRLRRLEDELPSLRR